MRRQRLREIADYQYAIYDKKFKQSRRKPIEFTYKSQDDIFEEIIEGDTKLLVPKKSLTDKVPPKEPAFFNPKAKVNRDFSIIAYAAFLKKFEGPKIFLEALSGVGARGLRLANELKIEKMYIL